MTWVKISDTALDDPRLLDLEPAEVLMHLEALSFSNRHGLDGMIPPAALRRLTRHPDPEAGAARLVAAGLWASATSGWQLVWLLKDQPEAAIVEKERTAARERMKAIRDRKRLHERGDHSLCDPKLCWVLRSGERSYERSGSPSRPLPSRPRDEGEEEREESGGATADAGGAEPAFAAPPARWGDPLGTISDERLSDVSEAGYSWCSRCQGIFPDAILLEDKQLDFGWCPNCAERRARRSKDCLAFKKSGVQCGNDHQPDSLWCRFHKKEQSRGQAAEAGRPFIDRLADQAIASLAVPA